MDEPLCLVSKRFGIGISTCHKVMLEVCGAIRMPRFLQWPADDAAVGAIRASFEAGSGVPGVVGAITLQGVVGPDGRWRLHRCLHWLAGPEERGAKERDAFTGGAHLDSFTVVRILTACARVVVLVDLDAEEAAWRATERVGFAGSVFVATAVVDLYLKCGEVAKARG